MHLELTVFLAVILAALLHATWNALVKSGADKNLSMTAVTGGGVVPGVLALPFVPLPEAACLPFLIGGVFLHVGYQLFLLKAYQAGEFTQVYPIARGTAPLLVAAVSVLVLGVALSVLEMLAIAVIGAGIISLCFVRASDGARNTEAAVFALITACFIAAYSLVDGYGARASGTAVGFFAWLSIGDALALGLYMYFRQPGLLTRVAREGRFLMLFGGGASFCAYAIVIWAFTQAPIPLVTALRETSIVFALLIGVLVLREPLNLHKVASTFATLCGAALLKFAR
jgi:drug/metabolite transporter (DMT)-like permease